VKERRQWNFVRDIVPRGKALAWTVSTGSLLFLAGAGSQVVLGEHATLPDSVRALGQRLTVTTQRVRTVEDSVSAVGTDVRALGVTVDTHTVALAELGDRVGAASARLDHVEAAITTVFHELQRIRCLARVSATGPVSALEIDDLCP
jgi:hypothetical protein